MIENDDTRYIIYDATIYSDLVDEDEWLEDTARNLGMTVQELKKEGLDLREASEQRYNDLDLETFYIDKRFDERVREMHPEWGEGGGAPYLLMARGTAQRWDGESRGHNYYAPGGDGDGAFAALVSDSDRGGILQDCEIESIWEDRAGTLHVRGVHNDGAVELACRAVPPGTRDAEEWLRWSTSDPHPWIAAQEHAERAWDQGVDAAMVDYYGFTWPDQGKLSALEMECALSYGPVEVAEPATERGR